MSDLQISLKKAGLLGVVEARAQQLGVSIEEAIRQAFSEKETAKLKPGTVEFYDAVLAKLTGDASASYTVWKDKAEKVAGHTLEPMGVYLYAISGKVATSLITDGELDTIEGAMDYVLGQ